MFYVEDILPMVWNDTAFDHLVYDEQQKDLIMSFVEHHGKKQAAFDDVIIGKGRSNPFLSMRTTLTCRHRPGLDHASLRSPGHRKDPHCRSR